VFETSGEPTAAYPFSLKFTSFRELAKAEEAISIYRASAIQAYWVKVNLGDQGTWYRVFGGHFKTPEDAEAFLAQNGLIGAVVKPTVFANWIGTTEDAAAAREKVKEISDAGFSPYVIQREDGKYHLYVGAFYTKRGAERQYRELEAKGIKNQIVAR
jgi:cell division septation protein DedD